ncbi:maleylacetate reductase [Tabrizicola sp. YIM 78059]|uniref:maleylacetate reductase n=1 Tax=Tabrizicola sp. YIM 78059 TaxID=2529861 RepID=UPI0010AADBC8|nr:maleylacetate reductase [Tabrizicola sp. YIM 78059]
MTRPFVFPGLSTRVVFGHGTLAQVPDEVARMGHSRALILSTPHQRAEARALADRLGDKAAGIFAGAAMHTPVEVTEQAIAAFRAARADCVVSLGGGSTTGLGKAIAVRTGADQLVIPTTYAGSEMTDILGETAGGEKTTRRDPAIRPEVVVYDVDLTLTLPVALTVTSALNAIAHAMEGFYAPDRHPITEALSRDAMVAFRDALPVLIEDPVNGEARARALYAAWGCSVTLGHVTMALHHKLAHVLGGSFGLPHAETHAVLLPHTTAYNEAAVGGLLAPIADTFGHGSAGAGLWHFAKAVNAPLRLADLGMTEGDLDRAAEIATRNPYANPRPVSRDGIRQLLQQAWDGQCPA